MSYNLYLAWSKEHDDEFAEAFPKRVVFSFKPNFQVL